MPAEILTKSVESKPAFRFDRPQATEAEQVGELFREPTEEERERLRTHLGEEAFSFLEEMGQPALVYEGPVVDTDGGWLKKKKLGKYAIRTHGRVVFLNTETGEKQENSTNLISFMFENDLMKQIEYKNLRNPAVKIKKGFQKLKKEAGYGEVDNLGENTLEFLKFLGDFVSRIKGTETILEPDDARRWLVYDRFLSKIDNPYLHLAKPVEPMRVFMSKNKRKKDELAWKRMRERVVKKTN